MSYFPLDGLFVRTLLVFPVFTIHEILKSIEIVMILCQSSSFSFRDFSE
jgi:hypothetical protein